MAKRKSTPKLNNDTKAATIVTVLFILGIVLFFIFTKSKEPHQENLPTVKEAHEVSPTHGNVKTTNGENFPEPSPQPMGKIPGIGGKIAFIIDDWGQSVSNCKYLKEIPQPVAVSILPGLRHTKDVANCAKLNHKLTMLHLPLEALHNYDFYPKDYIIKTSMDHSLVTKITNADLDQLPNIEGVNNHMGSKATESRPLMQVIFREIKKRKLFFVDSMTAHKTVCADLAEEMGLSFGKRDIFLDNINTRDAIIKQFVLLAKKARHSGYAVAIGHDRHLTMQILKEEMPWLEKQGFDIVSIKELLKIR